MTLRYTARVLAVGPDVADLARSGVLVLFGPGAPEELAAISVVTGAAAPIAPVAVGDRLTVGTSRSVVIGVGDRVDRGLAELGHATIRFAPAGTGAGGGSDGAGMAEAAGLPGELVVRGPSAEAVVAGLRVGDRILIERPDP